MGRSPGFGSNPNNKRPIKTRFRYGYAAVQLNLLIKLTHRLIIQKARRHPINEAPTDCKHTVSGSISLPSRGAFHLSLTVLIHYRSPNVFSLTRWSSLIQAEFLVFRPTRDTTTNTSPFHLRDFHPLRSNFPDRFDYKNVPDIVVPLPPFNMGLG